ncbi:MAG TPA: PepSY domain-containing protein [Caulobacteraceae bacterium]|jgi:uncharacterized membrane protein YkoI|nr:PepSY domain-containing protein [Caulobacteraceae bacterium]
MTPSSRALPGLMFAASLLAGLGAHGQPSPTKPVKPAVTQAPQPPRPNSLGADWRLQQDEARQGVRTHQLMPLARVIQQVRARTPGRQLDTGLEYQGERPIYRVRWMTKDGRRIDYLVDATTGAILSGK